MDREEVESIARRAARIEITNADRRSAETQAIPVAAVSGVWKLISSGWGVAIIVGAFFGVKLFFAEVKLSRVTGKYEASKILLDNERAKSASLKVNTDSLQNQSARKKEDKVAEDKAQKALENEPITTFNPPSIKRAIGILRKQQQTSTAEAGDSNGGEP